MGTADTAGVDPIFPNVEAKYGTEGFGDDPFEVELGDGSECAFGEVLAARSSGFGCIGREPAELVDLVSSLNGLEPVDDLTGDHVDVVFSAGNTAFREPWVGLLGDQGDVAWVVDCLLLREFGVILAGDHGAFTISFDCNFSVKIADFFVGDHGNALPSSALDDVEEDFLLFRPSGMVTDDALVGAPNKVLFPMGFVDVVPFATKLGDHFCLVLSKGIGCVGRVSEVLVPSVAWLGDQLVLVLPKGFNPWGGVSEVSAPATDLIVAPGRLLCPVGFENTLGKKDELASSVTLVGSPDELLFAVSFWKRGDRKGD